MNNHYVLIDYENAQLKSIAKLKGEATRVLTTFLNILLFNKILRRCLPIYISFCNAAMAFSLGPTTIDPSYILSILTSSNFPGLNENITKNPFENLYTQSNVFTLVTEYRYIKCENTIIDEEDYFNFKLPGLEIRQEKIRDATNFMKALDDDQFNRCRELVLMDETGVDFDVMYNYDVWKDRIDNGLTFYDKFSNVKSQSEFDSTLNSLKIYINHSN